MQLCQFHFYQKIARKKVARVNAALRRCRRTAANSASSCGMCYGLKFYRIINQRWSPRERPWPRGHILKPLASKLQFLENCSVLDSRTALFFELLKVCGAPENFFEKRFFLKIA